jgi:hypothetical protein
VLAVEGAALLGEKHIRSASQCAQSCMYPVSRSLRHAAGQLGDKLLRVRSLDCRPIG